MKFLFKLIKKVRIVHSIPGRVRILVPGLKDLPDVITENEEYIMDFIKMLPGVNSLSYSKITEKVLIFYDTNILDDKQIMAWINKIEDVMLDNVNKLENLNEKTLKPTIEFFHNKLMQEMTGGN